MPHHPFCGLVVPLPDPIHEISESHLFLRKIILQYSYPNAIRINIFHPPTPDTPRQGNNRMKKNICLLGFLIFFWQTCACSQGQLLKVHFIEVGYGDAILIEHPALASVLIDTGPEASGEKLLDYLSSAGVKEIGSVILTHPHENHFGGLQRLAGSIPTRQVFINGDLNAEAGYEPLLELLKEKEIPVTILKKNDLVPLAVPGMRFLILHPTELSDDVNANSIVSWLSYGQTSFLFTSDINEPVQDQLIQEFPEVKTADCLQVPHHGGKVSDGFAGHFSEAFWVVSTGTNPWGKPHKENLRKLKGKIVRTDIHGTVVVESDGQNVKLVQPRSSKEKNE